LITKNEHPSAATKLDPKTSSLPARGRIPPINSTKVFN
jgi:hypothetical protein